MSNTVRDIASQVNRPLLTIEPDATVQGAIQIMSTEKVSALPVMEGDRMVGIISERDYIRKVASQRIPAWSVKVREVMTERVITVTMEDTIRHCMEEMTSHRIRHLPVVEDNQVVTILSITDVLAALQED